MNSLPHLKAPPIWQRLQWIFDPVGYLEGSDRRYPDIFVTSGIGFGNQVLMVSHPQAIQQILTSDRKQFAAPGEFNRILEPIVGTDSVITISGLQHRQRRQLVMPSFHGDRMKDYGKLIQTITRQSMARLNAGEPFLGRNITQSISLQVIVEAVFGLSEGDRYQEMMAHLSQLAEMFRSPLKSIALFFPSLQKDWGERSPWGNFLRQRQQIDKLIYAEIAERRANFDETRTDILNLLMAARDEAGEALSEDELRDELLTLLFAGHETTATALAWGLYWFHRQPETLAQVRSELANLGDSPDPMAIFRLPYLTAFCQETLRIHPVAMLTFPRVARETVEIMGYKLEPDTIVLGCMYLIHQREDLYPNPKQFRPERFLERSFSPYEFIPFGGGARRCIGEALALFELKLVLATIAMGYDLELASDRPEKPRRRGVTLAPERGVPLVFKGDRAKVPIGGGTSPKVPIPCS
jgi:cytochrome P450